MKIPVQIVLCDMYRIIAVPGATLRLPLNRRLDMLFSLENRIPLTTVFVLPITVGGQLS
jgi:hypothetical protein